MAHAETTYKVIKYVIDPKQSFVGKVPDGKTVKTFVGKDAMKKATAHADKLNEKQADKSGQTEIIGYYVKGDLVVESKGIHGS